MPNTHYAKTLYGVPREKITSWWNALAYSTKQGYKEELYKLGMDRRDEYEVSTYLFGNLWPATKRAIAKLYKKKHEG